MSEPLEPADGDPDYDDIVPDEVVAEPAADSLVSTTAIREETLMLERAIGGWRGVFDSAAPSFIYLIVYLPTKHLAWAVTAAVLTGIGIAAWRVKAKRSVLQISGGLVGVGISAVITLSSHQARGFFLYGMILNAVYGSAFLISLLVNRPLVGYIVGAATGDITGWLKHKKLRRVYAAATWIWVFVFAIRLIVRVPLYLANAVGWLGITGIAMGWPLYLLAAWFTYLLLAPVLKEKREHDKAAAAAEADGAGEVEASATDEDGDK
jgi:hypothetical protein